MLTTSNIMRTLLFVIPVLLASGCATQRPLHVQKWESVRPGMTMDQVRDAVGEPTTTIKPEDGKTASAAGSPSSAPRAFGLFQAAGVTWEYMSPEEIDAADNLKRALEHVMNGPFDSSHVVVFDASGKVATVRPPKAPSIQ